MSLEQILRLANTKKPHPDIVAPELPEYYLSAEEYNTLISALQEWLREYKGKIAILDGDIIKELPLVSTTSGETPTNENIFTALRVVEEINKLYNLSVSKFLSKENDDTARGKIRFAKGIELINSSDEVKGRITENGRAEFVSLKLTEWLEVPTIKYNRIEVQEGDKWRSPGGGIIESVTEINRVTGTGKAKLKLEPGEWGAVSVGDLCMGIFKSEIASLADDNTDDGKNNITKKGFATAYFQITSVGGDQNQLFTYKVRDGYNVHPEKYMNFSAFGNVMDPTRQNSVYETRTYQRFWVNVNTWDLGLQNIAAQFGDLSNLLQYPTIPRDIGTGYSAYLNNVYFSGKIKQIKAPKIINGVWHEWDYVLEKWVSTGVNSTGNPGSPGHSPINITIENENPIIVKNTTDLYNLWVKIQVIEGETKLKYVNRSVESLLEGEFTVVPSYSITGFTVEDLNFSDIYTYHVEKFTPSVPTENITISYGIYGKNLTGNTFFYSKAQNFTIVENGIASFKSIVFIRSDGTPSTPTGGSWESPLPTSTPAWSDGVPVGTAPLYMSTRVFTNTGQPPQQSDWTDPRLASDTPDIDFEYSEVTSNPGTPTTHPDNWSNTPTSNSIWMAIRKKTSGTWGDWQVFKIKGENGKDGTDIEYIYWLSTIENKFPVILPDSDTYTPPYPFPDNDRDSGWYQEPQGVSKTRRFEYVSYRKKVNGVWSRFTTPVIWTKYNLDAIIREEVFLRANSIEEHDISELDAVQSSNFVPSLWTPYPQGVLEGISFELMSYRTKEDDVWSKFSRPIIWARYSVDGISRATITLHKRHSGDKTDLTVPTGKFDYLFSTGILTEIKTGSSPGNFNGWTQKFPEDDGSPCYIIYASANSIYANDELDAEEFTEPIPWVKSGINTILLRLYFKSYDNEVPPNVHSLRVYNFETKNLENRESQDGWIERIPPSQPDKNTLWVRTAIAASTTNEAIINSGDWSEAVILVKDGKDGENGPPGISIPIVFRGEYSPDKYYYGNNERIDIVKTSSGYFKTHPNAGAFMNKDPQNTSEGYWISFGGEFESVATDLLIAEKAYISGFVFFNDKIVSRKGVLWAGSTSIIDYESLPQSDWANFIPSVLIDGIQSKISLGHNIVLQGPTQGKQARITVGVESNNFFPIDIKENGRAIFANGLIQFNYNGDIGFYRRELGGLTKTGELLNDGTGSFAYDQIVWNNSTLALGKSISGYHPFKFVFGGGQSSGEVAYGAIKWDSLGNLTIGARGSNDNIYFEASTATINIGSGKVRLTPSEITLGGLVNGNYSIKLNTDGSGYLAGNAIRWNTHGVISANAIIDNIALLTSESAFNSHNFIKQSKVKIAFPNNTLGREYYLYLPTGSEYENVIIDIEINNTSLYNAYHIYDVINLSLGDRTMKYHKSLITNLKLKGVKGEGITVRWEVIDSKILVANGAYWLKNETSPYESMTAHTPTKFKAGDLLFAGYIKDSNTYGFTQCNLPTFSWWNPTEGYEWTSTSFKITKDPETVGGYWITFPKLRRFTGTSLFPFTEDLFEVIVSFPKNDSTLTHVYHTRKDREWDSLSSYILKIYTVEHSTGTSPSFSVRPINTPFTFSVRAIKHFDLLEW